MDKLAHFQTIFNAAKEKHLENKKAYEQILDEEKRKEAEQEKIELKKRKEQIGGIDPKDSNFSVELYELIHSFGFVIDSYEKNEEIDQDWYGNGLLETYYCSFGNWQFKVKHYADVDIEEGIFSLSEIIHKTTKQEVDFYCDLGCRNTSESRRTEGLELLKYPSFEEYAADKYHKYVVLPELLRKKGYVVNEIDYSFQLNNPSGYLALENNLFLKVYRNWDDVFQLVVTNDHSWNTHSSNNWHSILQKAYVISCHSENDIDEVCETIEAFKLEQQGKMGYYDENSDTYFSNKDVLAFYNSLRDKNDYYKEAWNTYLIRLKHFDGHIRQSFHSDDSLIVNKRTGLEICVKTELTFNDAAQWSKGNNKNTSLITFELDKRKSDRCRLHIENYEYTNHLFSYDDEDEPFIKGDKLVGEIEEYGTFSEMMELLQNYVLKMIEIHEIEL